MLSKVLKHPVYFELKPWIVDTHYCDSDGF